jgi:hypothetical protein
MPSANRQMPEPGPPRREYDSRVGWAICALHCGNMEDVWGEKDTECVARPISQQDVVDVHSCSVKRWPRDLVSAAFLERLRGLRRTTSLCVLIIKGKVGLKNKLAIAISECEWASPLGINNETCYILR